MWNSIKLKICKKNGVFEKNMIQHNTFLKTYKIYQGHKRKSIAPWRVPSMTRVVARQNFKVKE